MHTIEPPVSTGLILICDKCGKRAATDHDKNPSRQLQSRVKKAARERFGKAQIRVVLTSCLDICPPERISVAIVPVNSPAAAPRFFAVKVHDLEGTSEKILQEVRKAAL